jgi:hypothetical protein
MNTFAQSCDNYAQLRAFNGVPGMSIWARGAITLNDGGQGFFCYTVGSASDNGSTILVIPSAFPAAYWQRNASSLVGYGAVRVVTSTGGGTVTASDQVISVQPTNAAVTITLPIAASSAGRQIIVKDGRGEAATYPITITTADGSAMDAATTFVIATPYGGASFISDGTQWSILAAT